MKKFFLIPCLLAIFYFSSCKKDSIPLPKKNVQETPATVYPNYSNLKVGNYWIYERFRIDSLGNAVSVGIVDSCYIEKDTIIHGDTYYKYTGPEFNSMSNPSIASPVRSGFLRDSLSYLIDSYGNIMFSSQNFYVFDSGYNIAPPNDTIYNFITQITDYGMNTTVPAGTYVTTNLQTSYTFYNGYIIYWKTRTKNTRYAENVGMVSQDWGFFLGMPDYWQRQLIRYHFN